jgi:ACR3 family arsenite efflux pump ArsB
MLNYLKNFLIKLIFFPIIGLIGLLFLLILLFAPKARLISKQTTRGKHGRKEESKDYEAFY